MHSAKLTSVFFLGFDTNSMKFKEDKTVVDYFQERQ